MRQRQRARGAAGAHEAGRDAGVRFAGQAVEGGRRRAVGQGQDVFVQRIAGGQAVQRVGDGALVGALGRVREADRAVGRHQLAFQLQRDVLRAVAQCRVQIGIVGQDGVELPANGARRQNGVLAAAREAAFRSHMHHGPCQIGGTADRDAGAIGRSRVGRHLIDSARQEGQVARHVERAVDRARRQGRAALQCGGADLARALQQRAIG
ncbi:hypothetical protein D3C73_1115460 [compost metagenome]